ncbi:uncharacterized protein BX664DRAFT_350070 [Halteromyces radiatus]|uniref:uncharacterized protein n=1 Tax=Halteromyces radiatus TaxID=101107 RepID=UPI00221EA650|nr:uncharacterized protein BX664DRAFT_350070 [Halteromyces radiatus]KAI8089699.1 hypothetical protein BX664DRAFT_350070 [Halteromyces radiatus]
MGPKSILPTNKRSSDQQEEYDPETITTQERCTDDPVWLKCKSKMIKGAGMAQNTLGRVTGLDDWEHRGQAWEEWGDHTLQLAERLTDQGAPSRLHGEYNRWMGYLEKMIGHVAGDEEMQYHANTRTEQATQEINQSRRI